MKYLVQWLNMYTYSLTFGHAQASIKKVPTPNVNHIQTAGEGSQPTTPTTPSYRQVVTEGGMGVPQAPAAPAANKVHKFDSGTAPRLEKFAPNGKQRTWHWKQQTNPQGGPRVHCAGPVPEECTDSTCQYYGNWLDTKGVCSYCLSTEHKKPDCPRHQAAVASWNAKHPKAENYKTPAQ